MLSFFPDFQSVSDRGYGNNLATCPSNQQLLSCGLMNYQTNNAEWYRSAVPISSSQCGCYDYWGVYCVAWCTNVPINNFEIIVSSGSGMNTAACSAGKLVIGTNTINVFVQNWWHWCETCFIRQICTCHIKYYVSRVDNPKWMMKPPNYFKLKLTKQSV